MKKAEKTFNFGRRLKVNVIDQIVLGVSFFNS